MRKNKIFNTRTMKGHIMALLVACVAFIGHVHAQNVSFALGTGWEFEDKGNGVAVDAAGNSYVVGNFRYKIILDNTSNITLTASDFFDAFVAKYSPSGALIWAKSIGGKADDYGFGISLDKNGNVYVTGHYQGEVTVESTTLTSKGKNDVFIAKYNTMGTLMWAKSAGGDGDDTGLGISTDAAGNCYITGFFDVSASFDNISLTGSGQDIFVAKYNTNGVPQWVRKAGGSNDDAANGIATDANGNSYVTGFFSSSATFAQGTSINSNGAGDIFVAKYDANGNLGWVKGFGGQLSDKGYGISIDQDGNSYVTGYYSYPVNFGVKTINSHEESRDIFAIKLNPNGEVQWVYNAGGKSSDTGRGIYTDSKGNVYVTGEYQFSVDFGVKQVTSAAYYDMFVLKLNAQNGSPIWLQEAKGQDFVSGKAITGDGNGNIFATGFYYLRASIGSKSFGSGGDADFLLTKIADQ